MPPSPATLYVSDLDGTLIRDDLSLSPWARGELVAMLEEGLPLTIATARSISSLTAILGDIPFRLPVVEFGGAFLTDYRTRRHMLVNAVDPAMVGDIHAAIAATGMHPFLSTYDGKRDWLFYTGISNEGEKAYHEERVALRDDRLRRVDDLAPALLQQVVCFTMIEREEALTALAESLEHRFGGALQKMIYRARYSPGWHFLSVHGAGATKAAGIRALQKAAGLEGARLVVFGDDVNDMGMFRIASHAVAMSNAHPGLKALAHEVIGSNEEDSVVQWLRGRRA